MLTNSQVMNYQGSNLDLCNALGITRKDGQPDHWMNFTVRPLKIRATEMVAHGKGDEEFQAKPGRERKAVTQTPVMVALPQTVAALIPAITLKLQMQGHDVSSGLKTWLFENSQPADEEADCEAILPDEVIDVLGFFCADSSENERALLAYAGIKTLRTVKIDRIMKAIKVLEINLNTWDDDRLDDLSRALTGFALCGNNDNE